MVILKGNLPGEPPIELGPVGSRMVIRDCDDCPFSRDGDMSVMCVLVPLADCYGYGDDPKPPLPPRWCPLNTGPVTVEIRKP